MSEGMLSPWKTAAWRAARSSDRLRLSSTGALHACLFSAAAVPLRPALRGGVSDQELGARRAIGE